MTMQTRVEVIATSLHCEIVNDAPTLEICGRDCELCLLFRDE
jgi:hypothetical protein